MRDIKEIIQSQLTVAALMFTFESLASKGKTEQEVSESLKQMFEKETNKFLEALDKNDFIIVPKEPALAKLA